MDSSKAALLAVATVLVMLRLAQAGGVNEYPIANPPAPAADGANAVRCAPVQIGGAKGPSSTNSAQHEQQRQP